MKTKTKSLVRINGLYREAPVYRMWAKSLIKLFSRGVWRVGFGVYFSVRKCLTDEWLVYDEKRKDYKSIWIER